MLRPTLEDGALDLPDDPHVETVDNRKRNAQRLRGNRMHPRRGGQGP